MAVASQKGGVGKTTTSVNLACSAVAAGKKVLLIDFDPQGNSSDAVGMPHRSLEPPTVYEALWGKDHTLAEAIRPTAHGFDICPANNNLSAFEWEVAELLGSHRSLPLWAEHLRQPRRVLAHHLRKIAHRYDLILIDCPPSLGVLTMMALVAADRVLIPVQTEYLSSSNDTAEDLLETIQLVQTMNPRLKIAGIVLTMFDGRRNHDIRAVERVKRFWTAKGVRLFETVIARSVTFADAAEAGQPAIHRGGKASEFADLAEEVLLYA